MNKQLNITKHCSSIVNVQNCLTKKQTKTLLKLNKSVNMFVRITQGNQ